MRPFPIPMSADFHAAPKRPVPVQPRQRLFTLGFVLRVLAASALAFGLAYCSNLPL